jgi:hypothetical protein
MTPMQPLPLSPSRTYQLSTIQRWDITVTKGLANGVAESQSEDEGSNHAGTHSSDTEQKGQTRNSDGMKLTEKSI